MTIISSSIQSKSNQNQILPRIHEKTTEQSCKQEEIETKIHRKVCYKADLKAIQNKMITKRVKTSDLPVVFERNLVDSRSVLLMLIRAKQETAFNLQRTRLILKKCLLQKKLLDLQDLGPNESE